MERKVVVSGELTPVVEDLKALDADVVEKEHGNARNDYNGYVGYSFNEKSI